MLRGGGSTASSESAMGKLKILDLGDAIRETRQFAPVQSVLDNMYVFGWVY